MKSRDTIHDLLQLPRYWAKSATARHAMTSRLTKIPYGPHRRQYLLLLEPVETGAGQELPWALYFHGGAWTFGTPEAFRPAARPWLAAGFRVALPSFRRPPTVKLPTIVEDCKAAVAKLAEYANDTGRPLSTPQIGGISAGGHLAALLALHPEWWTGAGWPAPPDRALLCAAPLDLRLLRPRQIFLKYQLLNPVNRLDHADRLQWLLLHGTSDGMVDYTHATRFRSALKQMGASNKLLTISGGGHLDAGRWTYDDRDPCAAAVAGFIRLPGQGRPVPG